MNQQYVGMEQVPQKKYTFHKIAIVVLLALMLVANLLIKPWAGRGTVKFSEMEYTRPETEVILEAADKVIALSKEKGSYDDIMKEILKLNLDYVAYYTQYSLCNIMYSVDSSDKFYSEEQDFFAKSEPTLSRKLDEMYYALAGTEYEDKLEEDYFGEDFFEDYRGENNFSSEVAELLSKESELINRYTAFISEHGVEYNGKKMDLFELSISVQDPDTYKELVTEYYKSANQKAGETYLELLKIRKQISQRLGYDSYAQYCFGGFNRNYSVEDAESYCLWVKEELVPLYERLCNDGVYGEYSQLYSFTEEELWDIMDKVTKKLGSEIKEAYSYMKEFELYHVAPGDNKLPGAFTTYIYDYNAPFIVMSPMGDSTDLATFSHEFGHFFDLYKTWGDMSDLELAECASQIMEVLVTSNLESAVSQDDARHLHDLKMLELFEAIITQCSYYSFESAVYALEDPTIDDINAIAEECFSSSAYYFPDELRELVGLSWIRITHFFVSPFYTVSYSLSADVAMQFYTIDDPQDLYCDMLGLEGDFMEVLGTAGLREPFKKESVLEIKKLIEESFLKEK